MARKKPDSIPSIKLHKATGQAYVNLSGRRCYLGTFGSPEVEQRHHRLVAEWTANGRQPLACIGEITITEVLARFWRHAAEYYGEHNHEVEQFKQAVRPLQALYGGLPATEFSLLKLKVVRQTLVDSDLCRNVVNRHTQRIKQVIKWATENELILPAVLHGLQAISARRAD